VFCLNFQIFVPHSANDQFRPEPADPPGRMNKKAPVKKGPASAKTGKEIQKSSLFESTPKDFRIGRDILPKRDLSRFMRWPLRIKIQRQKRVLLQKLKVPPAINQFTVAINKNEATHLLKLLNKYKPETDKEKRARMVSEAETRAKQEKVDSKVNPHKMTVGVSAVTTAVEQKRAKLVVIAHDVDPIELVIHLPALCRKMEVPYCIIKSKSRLGQLVHKKTCSTVCLESVRKEDIAELDQLTRNFMASFNNNVGLRKNWGGNVHHKDE